MSDTIERAIIAGVSQYVQHAIAPVSEVDTENATSIVQAAWMSGALSVVHLLAANDGTPGVNTTSVLSALERATQTLGLKPRA